LVLSPEVTFEAGCEEDVVGVTRAGQLLLGKNNALVRIASGAGAEIEEARNLWSACADLLPRFLEGASVTRPCEDALRECFVNALLHADYDFGHVEIALDERAAFFSNPGLPRTQTPGESEARNGRLLRIFKLTGLARGQGKGLGVIRSFDEKFELFWDTLELSTVAKLPLKTTAALRPLGWMPVAGEDKKEKKDQKPERSLPTAIPPILFKLMRKVPELPESFIDALRSDSLKEDFKEDLIEEPATSLETSMESPMEAIGTVSAAQMVRDTPR
jgi:hypothetical protein